MPRVNIPHVGVVNFPDNMSSCGDSGQGGALPSDRQAFRGDAFCRRDKECKLRRTEPATRSRDEAISWEDGITSRWTKTRILDGRT